MSCSTDPGVTHYAGCACHESRWAERLSEAEARAERLSAVSATVLDVLTEVADSACYWSDYDVPLGMVARVDDAKAQLAAALAPPADGGGGE